AEQQIRIDRGRSAWASGAEAGRCQFTLDNRTGNYSPRNPSGAYYGRLGRNTPVRVSVLTGSVALDLPGGDGDYASTPDASALDITGDLDIRIDATLENWILPDYPSTGQSDYPRTELIGKFASAQRSYALSIRASRPYLEWSTNGSTSLSARDETDSTPTSERRMHDRAALVDRHGKDGWTATF